MLRYFVRRVLLAVPVLLGVATLVFSLIHLVPGDPAQAMLGDGASPQDVAELRTSLGLDQPLLDAVRHVPASRGHRRSRRVVPHRPAGDDDDRRADSGDGGARPRRDARGDRDRHSAWRRRRGLARHRDRLRRHDVRAGRRVDSELLARAAAGDRVCRRARMAAGLGTRHAWRIWCCRRSRLASRSRRSWRA